MSQALTQLTNGKFTALVRQSHPGDVAVIRQILGQDVYGLRRIARCFDEIREAAVTVLDVGGHVGAFGMLALDVFPNARLVAFEPWPEACELYRQNIAAAILEGRATVLNRAVSYRDEVVNLFASADPKMYSGNIVAVGEGGAGAAAFVEDLDVSSRTMTLEEAAATTNSGEQGFILKLGCEGAEWEILRDMTRPLREKVRLALGQWHGNEYRRILEVMAEKFPHLHTATHNNRGYGYFWSLPRDNAGMRHLVADSLCLVKANHFMELEGRGGSFQKSANP